MLGAYRVSAGAHAAAASEGAVARKAQKARGDRIVPELLTFSFWKGGGPDRAAAHVGAAVRSGGSALLQADLVALPCPVILFFLTLFSRNALFDHRRGMRRHRRFACGEEPLVVTAQHGKRCTHPRDRKRKRLPGWRLAHADTGQPSSSAPCTVHSSVQASSCGRLSRGDEAGRARYGRLWHRDAVTRTAECLFSSVCCGENSPRRKSI